MNELIDVVVITYNRPEILRNLYISLSNQTVVPGIIVADDGTPDPMWAAHTDKLKGVIWHRHTSYQRVAMVNAGLSLTTAPYVILLDDDQLPAQDTFVETYLNQLQAESYECVVRGLGVTAQETLDLPPFFSTANIGFSTGVIWKWGGLDRRYNGYYGLEDRDFGRTLKSNGVLVVPGLGGTATKHIGAPYEQVNPLVDRTRNERVYIEKWGDLYG